MKRRAGNVKWMKILQFQSCPCPLEIHAKVNCLDRKYCHLSDKHKISFRTSHSNASCFYRCQPPPPPSILPSSQVDWKFELYLLFELFQSCEILFNLKKCCTNFLYFIQCFVSCEFINKPRTIITLGTL